MENNDSIGKHSLFVYILKVISYAATALAGYFSGGILS